MLKTGLIMMRRNPRL